MRVVTNTALSARRRRQATLLSVGGLAVLGLGLFLSLTRPHQILYAYVALVAGTLISWIGVALADKWLRPPRADTSLTAAMKGASRAFVLYNWSLPAEHVLLSPSGLWVFAVFNQEGPVTVRGDRWREERSLWRRAFSLGRRPVRNPRRLLDLESVALREALIGQDEDLEDVPIESVAVFTYRSLQLTLDEPTPPAVRAEDLRDWLRRHGKGRNLSPARRRRLEVALDRIAGSS